MAKANGSELIVFTDTRKNLPENGTNMVKYCLNTQGGACYFYI